MEEAYSGRSIKMSKDGNYFFKADVPYDNNTWELRALIVDKESGPKRPLTNVKTIPALSNLTIIVKPHNYQQNKDIGCKWTVTQIKINAYGGMNVPRFVDAADDNDNDIRYNNNPNPNTKHKATESDSSECNDEEEEDANMETGQSTNQSTAGLNSYFGTPGSP